MIKNRNKGTVVAEKFLHAKSFKTKLLGLLINGDSDALLLKTRFGIHTFFLKKAIDVLILDDENIVVDKKTNLLPNRIFIWSAQHSTVIELKQGSIASSKTDIGDKLIF